MAWIGRNQGYVRVKESDGTYSVEVFSRNKEKIAEAALESFNETIDYCYDWYLNGYDVPLDYLPDSVLAYF